MPYGWGAGIHNDGGSPTITNCVLWGYTPEGISADDANVEVSYGDVEGGWPGEGNIDDDPQFVKPDDEDYHLDSGSPCIDAADNRAVPDGVTTDLDGHPRFVEDPCTKDTGEPDPESPDRAIVDMGAYEHQESSRVPGDFDEDCDVDLDDYGAFAECLMGPSGGPIEPECEAGDFDNDDDIDLIGFRQFQLAFTGKQ